MASSPTKPDTVIAVAVPVPGLGLLSYRVPDDVDTPPKGARVLVPVGRRVMTGCVVGPGASPEGSRLRDIASVLDARPFLPPTIVDLALWVSEYYASGPGDALAVAMPPAARRGRTDAGQTIPCVELTDHGGAATGEKLRGKRQRQLVSLLASHPGGLPLATVRGHGVSSAVVRSLAASGVVRLRRQAVERDPFASGTSGLDEWASRFAHSTEWRLTDEQETVLRRLRASADAKTFHTALIHGVTGSGKTEVYLQITRHVLQQGGTVLVLVPEIGLTPALAGVFRTRLGDRVAIQHSALSDGERHDQWQRIRRGEVDVVVGTRSAVFAPLARLALIVVDEEHDSSYKQEETPRYHARDVAVVRGRMEGALVLLGTATPSMESAANAASGRYERLPLTRRVLNRPLATVRVVDMRREVAAHGAEVTFSPALLDAIHIRLGRHEQTLVLLNRRGYASVLLCRECGTSLECPHCSVSLTYHKAARRMRCHYCNHAAPIPGACQACGGPFLEQIGFGTERLESDLRERFPAARIGRIDRDTVRRKGAIARTLSAVARGELDVVVGTQMIAKGHDFPAVTLVGVVSADVGLGLADFRAAERTFQLLTQVVGRAGRGETAGEAIIQTLYPDHYSVRAAAAQDYALFFERELEFRRALHYPPTVSLINVVIKAPSLETAMRDALDLATRVRRESPGKVLGPAPAALARIKDDYRAQFFIKGTRRGHMREALQTALRSRPDLRRRAVVDVDPVMVV